jgi:PKD repeat protein
MKHLFHKLLFLSTFIVLTNIVQAQCKALFQYSANGTAVNFYDSSITASGNGTYRWTFGDGTSSNAKNPSHSYNSFGPYTVCLIVKDSFCSDTTCMSISLGGSGGGCKAKFTDSTSALDAYFYSTSIGTSNNTTYTWDFGDNTTDSNQNPTHRYAASGQYYVCLSISDSNCNDNFCQMITVSSNGSNCTAKFIDSIVGNKVYFTNYSVGSNGSKGFNSSWSFGDSSFATGTNASHTYSSPGVYYVCLTISDSNCSDTYCATITIGNPNGGGCNADFSYTNNQKNVSFTNLSTSFGNPTYRWSFGDGTSSTSANPSHQYNSYGSFTVCLIISDSNCSDTICKNISVYNKYVLSGAIILKNTNLAAYPAMVWAIVYDTTAGGTLTAIDSTYTDSVGFYMFNLVIGDYLIKAALVDTNAANYHSFMPTYYNDKLRWDTANLITLNSNMQNIDINLLAGNNPGGPGFIGGKVSQGANKNGNIGDPMKGVYILLTNNKDEPVTYTYSDANGNYSFSNLAYGTYTITGDMVGKKAYSLQVSISNQKPSIANVNVEINSVSVVVQNGITNESNYSKINGLAVYPNPASDYIYIKQEKNEKYIIDIIDITGKSIQLISSNEPITTINVSDLQSGMYIVKVTDSKGNIGIHKTVKN